MLELSTTLNFTHMNRDLVAVDDTGMYALVSQMSKKIVELDKQVQNPPWFAKVMRNIERIDKMETTLDSLVDQVASLNKTVATMVINDIKNENSSAGAEAGEEKKEEVRSDEERRLDQSDSRYRPSL